MVITFECDANVLTLTAGLASFTYLVESGSDSTDYTPTWSATNANCATSYTWFGRLKGADDLSWEEFDSTTIIDWADKGITSATSVLTIDMTDPTKFPSTAGPVTYEIFVVYQATDPNVNKSPITDYRVIGLPQMVFDAFELTMIDACYYNTITCDELPDITYEITADLASPTTGTGWNADLHHYQTAVSCTFTGVDNDGTTLTEPQCPLTQELQYLNTATNTWTTNTDHIHPDAAAANPCLYADHADGTDPCVYGYKFDNTGGAYNTLLDPVEMRWKVIDARS